jgi:hypothetical protein
MRPELSTVSIVYRPSGGSTTRSTVGEEMANAHDGTAGHRQVATQIDALSSKYSSAIRSSSPRIEQARVAHGLFSAIWPTICSPVGLGNKEVAARLFVSPRTVQAHLIHVYTKLGLTSRVQLAQEAARRA